MLFHTGQTHCYDEAGKEIPCQDSGQDGEFRIGASWPEPRFVALGGTVLDQLTGLIWSRDANPNVFPVTWQEALEGIAAMNDSNYLGYNDWRMPNRLELRSLMSYQTKKPSLPSGHLFENIFLGWYWTSTSAAIHLDYAWYIHLEGARMFYGRKDQYYLFWPVRGEGNGLLHRTGQTHCFDIQGKIISGTGSGQDGDYRLGHDWPVPRFVAGKLTVLDRLTNLCWARKADSSNGPVTWHQALAVVQRLNKDRLAGLNRWRLPNINELESLVDCAAHTPALSADHPFINLRDSYWSATTSFFETDWAWVLYLEKGACGVGYKPGKTFFVWPVSLADSSAGSR